MTQLQDRVWYSQGKLQMRYKLGIEVDCLSWVSGGTET